MQVISLSPTAGMPGSAPSGISKTYFASAASAIHWSLRAIPSGTPYFVYLSTSFWNRTSQD
jgi:hypothetical protein